MNRTISTACVTPEGLCFAADFSGFLHCLDAKTGQVYWTYDMESSLWGSPMYADGKIFLTSEEGQVRVLKAGPGGEILTTNEVGDTCMATPAISDGMIFYRTQHYLIGIARQLSARTAQR